MIDSSLLLENYLTTAQRLRRKGVEQADIDATREALVRRNELQTLVDQLRAERNRLSKEIGQLIAAKRASDAEALKTQVSASKAELESAESQ